MSEFGARLAAKRSVELLDKIEQEATTMAKCALWALQSAARMRDNLELPKGHEDRWKEIPEWPEDVPPGKRKRTFQEIGRSLDETARHMLESITRVEAELKRP